MARMCRTCEGYGCIRCGDSGFTDDCGGHTDPHVRILVLKRQLSRRDRSPAHRQLIRRKLEEALEAASEERFDNEQEEKHFRPDTQE